jgi:hypothetical protein
MARDDYLPNTIPGAVNGRQLLLEDAESADGLTVTGPLVGQTLAGGAGGRTWYIFAPTAGAQTATFFLRLTYAGADPTATVVQTMYDGATPRIGATVQNFSAITSGAWSTAQVTGLEGEAGCLIALAIAAGVTVTVAGAEYTAL